MQSLNVGLREAHDLGERMAGILHGAATAADLETYDDRRQAEWRLLSGQAGAPTGGADAFVKRHATRILTSTPASGAELRLLLGQVGLSLPER
jgi:hypothetical protein